MTVYEKGRWSELPGWGADNVDSAWSAFLESCHALRFRPEWSAPCASAQTVPANSAASIRAYFENTFEPYKIVKRTGPAAEDTGLITGYFEPLLYGSRTPSARFVAPLYAPPPDLLIIDLTSLYPELKGKRVRGRLEGNKVLPYYTRAELPTDPTLKGHEIVWIDSAFEAMMLEVQGSGRVQLADGSVIRLLYADQNGQPYHSIGKYLVTVGALTVEQATIPGIRAWLAAHPERIQEVLDANPSVVFFSEAPLGDPNLGPKGAQGIPLTSGRSIAVDPNWIPLGTPVFHGHDATGLGSALAAARDRTGYGRSNQRRAAGRLFLRQWAAGSGPGGQDAAAREFVDVVAAEHAVAADTAACRGH